MNKSTTEPNAVVILRVQLAKMLDAEDLGSLNRLAVHEGSLDAAVLKVLQMGLASLKAKRGGRK